MTRHLGAGLSSPAAARLRAKPLSARPRESPQIALAVPAAGTPESTRDYSSPWDGEGHREADSPALADLISDGGTAARHGQRDQERGGGVQRDERGRIRAPVLRRPIRARCPRNRAQGGEAGGRAGRAGDVFAAPGELPSPAD